MKQLTRNLEREDIYEALSYATWRADEIEVPSSAFQPEASQTPNYSLHFAPAIQSENTVVSQP